MRSMVERTSALEAGVDATLVVGAEGFGGEARGSVTPESTVW